MKVTVENKTIEISKLPIGRYKELLDVLRLLPAKINLLDLSKASNNELFQKIPELIINNLPEAIKIIHIGSGIPEEEVEKLGLNECIDLILAIVKVNEYAEVYEKIKKGLALLPKTSPTLKQIGSQTQ